MPEDCKGISLNGSRNDQVWKDGRKVTISIEMAGAGLHVELLNNLHYLTLSYLDLELPKHFNGRMSFLTSLRSNYCTNNQDAQ